MIPKLLHIYGPLELNGYNAAILLGIGIFFYAALRHPSLEKWVSKSFFLNICVESALVGVLGARLLHVVSDLKHYSSLGQIVSIWDGGLSILGAFLGVFGYSFWTLKRKNLPILPLYDIAALYAPLIQAFGRIGCFLVGCCYGCPTDVPWGITYTHDQSFAPLNISLHPTQLYSSLIFFGMFIVMRFVVAKRVTTAGEISMIYLMGMSFERWLIDFFRGDRIMMPYTQISFFSLYQWIALLIFIGALTTFLYVRSAAKTSSLARS